MPTQPLTPAQALWQHFNIAPKADTAPTRTKAVYQKELYDRLQQIGRTVASVPTMAGMASGQTTNWQAATKRENADEGLGLSEL